MFGAPPIVYRAGLRLMEWSRPVVVAILGTAALSCGGGKGEPTAPPDTIVRQVNVTPSAAAQLTAGATLQLVATAVNAEGDAVSGNTVTWSSSAPASAAVSASGVVSAGLVGAATITATVSGVTSTGVAVTVVAGVGAQLAVRTQPSAASAGVAFGVQPVVEVRDVAGNVAASTAVVTAAITTGGGTLIGSSAATAVAGVATFTNLGVAAAVGSHTLTFTAPGLTPAASAAFVVAAGIPSSYNVTVSTAAPIAGAAVAVTAQIVDSLGNPALVSGRTVTWSATGTGGTFSAPISITDASGTVTVQFTTGSAIGSYVVTAMDNGGIKGSSPTITSVVGPAAKYLVTSSGSSPVAGTAVTITAKLSDANGNLVLTAGRVVTWSATASGGAFSTPTSNTDATGTATIQFTTGTTVASYIVTATDNGAVKGSSAAIASIAGPPSTARSVLVANPTTLPADGHSTSAITLQLDDANGNAVHATGGTVVIASTAGTMSATTDNQDGTYAAVLTAPAVVGSAVVSATLGGAAVTSKDTVTISTNAGTQYVLTSSVASPVAGTAVTISAQLANTSGGAVAAAGHVVTWHVTGTGGTFGAPTSTTNAAGIASITFTTATTAGLATVSGTDAGALTGSLALTSVAGSAAKYIVTASSTTPVAGTAVTVTAQLADANSNPVSLAGQTVTWTVVGESGGALTPTTSVTTSSGSATTSYATGSSVGISYAVGAHDASFSGSVNITNSAGTLVSLLWSRPSRIVVTDTAYSAAAFTAVNQFGRSVASPSVTYTSGTPAAATVSGAGLLTPVARGQTMLVAAATTNAAVKDSALVAVATAGSPVVRTDLTRFDLKTDTVFTVTVIADMRSASLLGAATVEVTWDPTQLTYVSDADGSSGVGATVNTGNVTNGTLLLSMASSTGFGGSIQLRQITFHSTTTAARAGSLRLLVTEFTAATTFASLLATTLAITYPLVSR